MEEEHKEEENSLTEQEESDNEEKVVYTPKQFFENPDKIMDFALSRMKDVKDPTLLLKSLEELKTLLLTNKLVQLAETRAAVNSSQIINPAEAFVRVYEYSMEIINKFIRSTDSKDIGNVIKTMGVILEAVKAQASLAEKYHNMKNKSMVEEIILNALEAESPELKKKVLEKLKELQKKYLKEGVEDGAKEL